MNDYFFTVTEDEAGERLDKQLAGYLPDQSRTYLTRLLHDGNVTVSGKEEKASYRLKENDEIEISLPDPILPEITPEDIPLDILYEDDDVLVVNKPKGMVVHPAAGHFSGTLVNAVMYHCGAGLSGINGILRPGIVHRIDRDTTGSLIVCKNDESHRCIADQLKEHSITRKYIAIACGVIKEDSLTIDRNIGRDPKDRKKMAVVPTGCGKTAVTHCHVLERFHGYTFVECVLETGRTHQIRVHLASLGHPLLGDEVYGGARKGSFESLQGQCLHAAVLGFIHPRTGEYIETIAPVPDYFREVLQKLRQFA